MKLRVYSVTRDNFYRVGKFKARGLDAVLEFIGFTFLPNDPDLACMLDPADNTAVDVYDARTGVITRYEGANIDGTGEAFVEAMYDQGALDQFLADNDVHAVETSIDNIVY